MVMKAFLMFIGIAESSVFRQTGAATLGAQSDNHMPLRCRLSAGAAIWCAGRGRSGAATCTAPACAASSCAGERRRRKPVVVHVLITNPVAILVHVSHRLLKQSRL